MEAAIRPDDPVITAYRAHGWTYIRGVPMRGVLSELTGKYQRYGITYIRGSSSDTSIFTGNWNVGYERDLCDKK